MSREGHQIVRTMITAGLFFAALTCGASVIVLGSLVQEHQLQPGREMTGSFEVYNPDNRPQEIKVYQTDHFSYADGSTLYGEPGQLPRSNARWISHTPQRLLLPPNERLKVSYTVHVPDDTSLRGTYWSVLMVEPVSESSPESVLGDPSKPKVAIRQLVRYAVQIVTHLGTGGDRALKFSQIRLFQDQDRRVLAVDMENIGEQMLFGDFWTELYDGSGRLVVKLSGEPRRLYPGTSARFTVDLVGLLEVTYKALIVVDCGGDDVFGASANLVLGR